MRLYLRHSVARVLAGHLPSPATMVGYFGFVFPGVWVKYKDLLCAHCWTYNSSILSVEHRQCGRATTRKAQQQRVGKKQQRTGSAQHRGHASGGLGWHSVIHTGRRCWDESSSKNWTDKSQLQFGCQRWQSSIFNLWTVNCPKVWGHGAEFFSASGGIETCASGKQDSLSQLSPQLSLDQNSKVGSYVTSWNFTLDRNLFESRA